MTYTIFWRSGGVHPRAGGAGVYHEHIVDDKSKETGQPDVGEVLRVSTVVSATLGGADFLQG